MMWRLTLIKITVLLVAQAALASPQTVDPKEIDAAINKGTESLRKLPAPILGHEGIQGDLNTIKLLTLARVGVSEDDPDVQRLFQYCVNFRLSGNDDATYV